MKAAPDPTVLPKGKSHAKSASVSLSSVFLAKLQARKKWGRGKKVNLQRVSYAHMVWLYVLINVCRKEAVTLPENKETDFGDVEQSRNFSNTTATTGFQQTTYFALVCNRPPWHCQMTKLYLLFIHDQLFY